MDNSNIRPNIGLAIDGGGIKGAIVARGLMELEQQLGVKCLRDEPRLKAMAGTSTGAIINTAIAIGMSAKDILALYNDLGKVVFTLGGRLRPFGKTLPLIGAPHFPAGWVRALRRAPGGFGDFLLYPLLPARYDIEPMRRLMQEQLQKHGLDPNITIRGMTDYLQTLPGQPTLIYTVVEVLGRRTHFIKTDKNETFQDMLLVDAVLASSCIPLYFDPIRLPDEPGQPTNRRVVDGGVGSFGNPASVVAWELCDERNPSQTYSPADVTLFSFGTGYVPTDVYSKSRPPVENWWALTWVSSVSEFFIDDAIREQSRNIVAQYRGIDLRRFQVAQDRNIAADNFDLLNTDLKTMGERLQVLIRENRHALRLDPQFRNDPEGIWNRQIAKIIEGENKALLAAEPQAVPAGGE